VTPTANHLADAEAYAYAAHREARVAALVARTADRLFVLAEDRSDRVARRSRLDRGHHADGAATDGRARAARFESLARYAMAAADRRVDNDLTEAISAMFSGGRRRVGVRS